MRLDIDGSHKMAVFFRAFVKENSRFRPYSVQTTRTIICKGKSMSCNTAPHAAGAGMAQEPDVNPGRVSFSPYLIGEDIVDRDAVAPPQLPADAPVPDVLKPPVVDFLKPFRHNLDVTFPHSLQGFTHCGKECRPVLE